MDFLKFQNYKASIDDLNKVLLMDPSIEEAKKELEETTQLFKVKVTDNSQQKPRKKIEIQEVFHFLKFAPRPEGNWPKPFLKYYLNGGMKPI